MSCEVTRRVAKKTWRLSGGRDEDTFDEALWMALVMRVTISDVLTCMENHRSNHLEQGLPAPLPVQRGSKPGELGMISRRSLSMALRRVPLEFEREPRTPLLQRRTMHVNARLLGAALTGLVMRAAEVKARIDRPDTEPDLEVLLRGLQRRGGE